MNAVSAEALFLKRREDIYQIITNQLRNLVSDIKIINVDKDEKRELLTLVITFKNGLELPAQSLSDGTLRFLGLAIIQEDSRDSLICMEEPENGINPKKIEEIVELLLQLSFDPLCPVNDDNPIRQVAKTQEKMNKMMGSVTDTAGDRKSVV